MVKKKYTAEKGDIVWLNFNPQADKEQAGLRPALVLSSQKYNQTGLMVACPITSKVKGYPFEVKINVDKIQGAVLADHVKNQDWQVRGLKFISKAPLEVQNQVLDLLLAVLIR